MTYIPHLTSPTVQPIRISRWFADLQTEAGASAKNAIVTQIQHMKNFRNRVFHEFLIITVQYNGGETKIIAERLRQGDPDQVIIGPWETAENALPASHSHNRSDHLYAVNFNGGSLKLGDLARIMRSPGRQRPKYNLIWANCYWFALVSYTAAMRRYAGQEIKKLYWYLRGKFAGLSWNLGWGGTTIAYTSPENMNYKMSSIDASFGAQSAPKEFDDNLVFMSLAKPNMKINDLKPSEYLVGVSSTEDVPPDLTGLPQDGSVDITALVEGSQDVAIVASDVTPLHGISDEDLESCVAWILEGLNEGDIEKQGTHFPEGVNLDKEELEDLKEPEVMTAAGSTEDGLDADGRPWSL